MTQVNQRLMTQILAGPEQAPIAPEDAVAAARSDWWTRVLLALTDDAGLHASWAREISPGDDSWDSAGRLAWVRAQIEQVDDRIDETLNEGNTETARLMLDALARAGIGWGGEPLRGFFDSIEIDDLTVISAAIVAAAGDPGVLRAAVGQTDIFETVVAYLRAASLKGASGLWDQFLIWHSRISDAADEMEELNGQREEIDELEGVGACLDPTLFARGLIAGDYEMGWAGRSELVADFLQTWGATDWLEVAALLEHGGSDAVETCSVFAVNAARGIGSEPPGEEEAKALIELLEMDTGAESDEAEDWEPLASDLGFQFQIAVGATVDVNDQEGAGSFGGLLAQISAHERLVYHGIHSPGVPGLPLSATSTKYIDVDAARAAIRELAASVLNHPESEEEIIRAVRTLCDTAMWSRRKPDPFADIAREVCDEFEGANSTAIRLARVQLAGFLDQGSLDIERFEIDTELVEALSQTGALATGEALESAVIETLGELADGESLAALDASRRLGLGSDEGATRRLARLWTDGPVRRAPFFRALLLESLASG